MSLEGETMNSHNMQGKTEKFLKTTLEIILKAQNTLFRDWIESGTSRQFKSPKTRVTNFEKFVLVFFTVGRSTRE